MRGHTLNHRIGARAKAPTVSASLPGFVTPKRSQPADQIVPVVVRVLDAPALPPGRLIADNRQTVTR